MLSRATARTRFTWAITAASTLIFGALSGCQYPCRHMGRPPAGTWIDAPCHDNGMCCQNAGFAAGHCGGLCDATCCKVPCACGLPFAHWLCGFGAVGAEEQVVTPPHSRFHPVPTHPVFTPPPTFAGPVNSTAPGSRAEQDLASEPLPQTTRVELRAAHRRVGQPPRVEDTPARLMKPQGVTPLPMSQLRLMGPANSLRVAQPPADLLAR